MIINMPQWAMGIADGTITEWTVKEGEIVEKDAILCEIDQNKMADSFLAPMAGKIIKIIAPAGESVQCGDPICEIE